MFMVFGNLKISNFKGLSIFVKSQILIILIFSKFPFFDFLQFSFFPNFLNKEISQI